jgi:hypothetical protein
MVKKDVPIKFAETYQDIFDHTFTNNWKKCPSFNQPNLSFTSKHTEFNIQMLFFIFLSCRNKRSHATLERR